ncbi:MAG: hypothetical protein BZ133_03880 [Methanosphaera sp. SHI613]|nr:MAG: hypothetical protein BZ133_03880 [Methanosphaera sp. SHI613]
MERLKNNLLLFSYMILIGIISGLIIWSFIKVMNVGINFFWDYLPTRLNFKYYTIFTCLIGGLTVGLFKHKYGENTRELAEVIKTVKTEHRYPYHNILVSILSALLPLVVGASVGPEAGLTGIIAGLCTWIGDKLKRFNNQLEDLTSIGVMATLATIFASPMFAFVEPLENEEDVKLPKTSKNILYFTAILSSFGVFILLNHLTNSKMGMHTMGIANLSSINPLYIVLLLFIGVALSYFYFASNVLVKRTFENMNDNHILKGVIGGLILGISGSLLPLTMFSGEHQIHMLLESGVQIGVLILIATSITKILLTNICIETGLKGGHFFPMIFSGVAMGYAMSIIMNIDPIVSMSVVTTALLANILKKPIAVVLLLMILFPVNMIPLMLLTAVISCLFKTSKTLLLA